MQKLNTVKVRFQKLEESEESGRISHGKKEKW